MNILSVDFFLFLAVSVVAYFMLPHVVRPVALLLASLIFYSFFSVVALAFVVGSACSAFVYGWMHARLQSRKTQRCALAAIIALNVMTLVLLKYFGVLTFRGSVIVPLGISFYTLQVIGYCVDVFKGTVQPERNPLKLLLFVSFFPTVMQGPISRYSQLAPQLWEPHGFSMDRVKLGLELMLWGYFKKTVIADRLGLFVNSVFAAKSSAEGFVVVFGVIAYSVQIYTDFSGCVDICRGVAQIFGIDLIENFKRPYFADSIRNFWYRWHISLSSWLKDYVYIPLGGNRKGALRKHVNVMIVFGVSGLWHGVGLTFFAWGLLHGLYQVLASLSMGVRQRLSAVMKIDNTTFSYRLGHMVWTFSLVTFAWIFFRAESVGAACSVISRMFVYNPWVLLVGFGSDCPLDMKDVCVLVPALSILVIVSLLQERMKIRIALERQQLWFRWTVYLGAIFSVLIFGVYGPGYDAAAFIYMQF